MAQEPDPPKVTRREVDGWLSGLNTELMSIIKGPTGELRARLALLLHRVEGWRERLGVKERK